MRSLITALMAIGFGYYLGGGYHSDFNYEWSKEANKVKGELLEEYEILDSIVQNTLFSVENADKGIYEDLIDEMDEMGYSTHRNHLLELYASQE